MQTPTEQRSDRARLGRLVDALRMILAGVALIVVLVALWDLTIRILGLESYVLPPPADVWSAFVDNRSFLFEALGVTLYESLIGMLLSIVIGVALAMAVVFSPVLRRTVMPSLVALNAAPKVALAPVLILWLGLGVNSKIGMAFLLSFFPIVVNAARGLGEVDPELIDYFKLMRAGRVRTFLKARLPNSLPGMFDGFKIALPIAIVGAVVGEFIASEAGIGYQMILAYSTYDTSLVFAALVLISAASTVLYGLLVWVESLFLGWRPD